MARAQQQQTGITTEIPCVGNCGARVSVKCGDNLMLQNISFMCIACSVQTKYKMESKPGEARVIPAGQKRLLGE